MTPDQKIKALEKFMEESLERNFPKDRKLRHNYRGQALMMHAEIALYARQLFRDGSIGEELHPSIEQDREEGHY